MRVELSTEDRILPYKSPVWSDTQQFSEPTLLHHAYLLHLLHNPGDCCIYRTRPSRMLRCGRVRVLEHRSRPTWEARQGNLQPMEVRRWLCPRRLSVLRGQ